jgi:two-component system, LytTR family, sensor kinase
LAEPKISTYSFILQNSIWWLGGLIVQTLILHYNAGFGWSISAKDALTTNLVMALAAAETIVVMRHYQPRQSLRFIYSVALAAVCTWLIKWLLNEWMSAETEYIAFVNQWIVVRGVFVWLMVSFISALSWMWFTLKEQEESQQRKTDAEKLSRETELTTLRQQLQPHFLFNSLNSISALAGARPEEARKMIQQLSDFLRGTIKRDDQQMVSLEDELNHLHLYLEIEKVRFGHRLSTEMQKQDGVEKLKLPALLLQPLVENAIKFGLYDTTGDIVIRIRASEADGSLVLAVENPFDPTTAIPKQGTGFGLSSIQRRLYLLFGRNDLLTTSQDGTVFISQVRIPQPL